VFDSPRVLSIAEQARPIYATYASNNLRGLGGRWIEPTS
jgi:hypothetical protein